MTAAWAQTGLLAILATQWKREYAVLLGARATDRTS
jgi:hypothetical protein